jgi:hypothetical protein
MSEMEEEALMLDHVGGDLGTQVRWRRAEILCLLAACPCNTLSARRIARGRIRVSNMNYMC